MTGVQTCALPIYCARSTPAPRPATSDGAAAEGRCTVAQIVKSLVFRGADSGNGVLVVASGANTVDAGRMEALLGEATERADAAFVRQPTGFAIGGVAPIGQTAAILCAIHGDLLVFAQIWSAGGAPNVVLTDGTAGDARRRPRVGQRLTPYR